MITGALYLDLSKAFDSISHATLMEKLPNFGITGIPQEWLCSYLFGRYQQVHYKQHLSSPEPLFCGIPQGSILGPLLFLLHFNDAASVLSKCRIVKYADDTMIYYSHKDIKEVEKVLNNDFASLTSWLEQNELVVNKKKDKTEVMIFGTSKRLNKLDDQQLQIKHHQSTINNTSTYRYFGLTLNKTLNMSEHVQKP